MFSLLSLAQVSQNVLAGLLGNCTWVIPEIWSWWGHTLLENCCSPLKDLNQQQGSWHKASQPQQTIALTLTSLHLPCERTRSLAVLLEAQWTQKSTKWAAGRKVKPEDILIPSWTFTPTRELWHSKSGTFTWGVRNHSWWKKAFEQWVHRCPVPELEHSWDNHTTAFPGVKCKHVQ